MSYVIIAIVNEMMYRSLHLAYWQWWRGGRPRMPGEACCLTSQEALTCTQHRDKATRSVFQPPLLNEGMSLPKASEMSLSRFCLTESVEWGTGMSERAIQNAGCYHVWTAQKPWLQTQSSFIGNEENACWLNKIAFAFIYNFRIFSTFTDPMAPCPCKMKETVSWSVTFDTVTPWTVTCQASLELPRVAQAMILEAVAILFSRINSTQGSNLGLLHCRQILYLWATRVGRTIKQRG